MSPFSLCLSQPMICTICNVLPVACYPLWCHKLACACPINNHCDLGCWGCGILDCLTSALCGCPPGMGYMVNMFKNRIQNYVERLMPDSGPKSIIFYKSNHFQPIKISKIHLSTNQISEMYIISESVCICQPIKISHCQPIRHLHFLNCQPIKH